MPIFDAAFVSDSVSEKTNVLLQNGDNNDQNLNGQINFLRGGEIPNPGRGGGTMLLPMARRRAQPQQP